MYGLDTSKLECPADVAIVEDIQGGTLEEHWHRHPEDAVRITSELGGVLSVMHARRNRQYGKLASVDKQTAQHVRCEHLALGRALGHLDHAARHIGRLRDRRKELEQVLHSMASAIRMRSDYRLIHSELGPDHVLVDAHGHPVVIDIDGLMFFDVEWEHAFLEIRFGERYQHLRQDDLDDARCLFYKLCLHLSLCSGPLHVLEGDFPDRELMMGIVEGNASNALAFVH